MRSISAVVIYSPAGDRILLCQRARDPYQGLLDFPGGRCEGDESAQACAYRKLSEETGIGREAVLLSHVMDFAYHTTDWCVQVFSGQLERDVPLVQGRHTLQWIRTDENFFDPNVYAGEGYIGHILAHMRMQLFAPGE